MSRRVAAGLVLVLGIAAGVSTWALVRSFNTVPPAQHPVRALADTTIVHWTRGHSATVQAATSADALTALGYIHGMNRAWTVTLWRRTALGTLSSAFGNGLLPIDRHARRLGLAHHARRTYAQLPPSTRRRLQAYTRGLNAALASPRVRRRLPFTTLPVQPSSWKPWHPLAVERLWAWLGTPEPLFANLPALHATDRRLRRWLHLHGRARSLAWAARPPDNSSRPVLFARHVLGSTAAPVLQEVHLQRPSGPPLSLATVPGTLIAPTGSRGNHAWTYLLQSRAALTLHPLSDSLGELRYDRIVGADGTASLLATRQGDAGLILDTTRTDSVRVLRWPGLRAGTDAAWWMHLTGLRADSSPADSSPADSPPADSLRLFRGTGLTMDPAGRWTVRGAPPVVATGPRSVLVGHSRWASQAARTLHDGGRAAPAAWSTATTSPWARALLPTLLPDLAPLSGTSPLLEEALSYLRNWNYRFERTSIGAVLFAEWMRAYRAEYGRMPGGSASATDAGPRRRRAFRRAVRTLAQQNGRDVRRWRWERVAQEQRFFPVWAADSLVAPDLSPLATTRYAPLLRPGHGHASTGAGGPSFAAPPPSGPAPTHWDGWMMPGDGLTARRLRVDPSALFERARGSRTSPRPVRIGDAPPDRTTRLVPARE